MMGSGIEIDASGSTANVRFEASNIFVYGWAGEVRTSFLVPISTIQPSYITAIS